MIIKFKYFQGKQHVHVAVFVGPDEEHLTLAGRLVLAPLEWEAFNELHAGEGTELHCIRSEDLI